MSEVPNESSLLEKRYDYPFTIIPNQLFDDEKLSCHAKMVYCVLFRYANRERSCFPSYILLSKKSGVSLRGIPRTLEDLESQHWLKKEKRFLPDGSRTSNLYVLKDPNLDKLSIPHPHATVARPPCHSGTAPMPPGHTNKIYLNKTHINKKKEDIVFPAELDNEAFKAIWNKYILYRKEAGHKALTPTSINTLFERMVTWGEKQAMDSIEITIANGWRGIFPPYPQTRTFKVPVIFEKEEQRIIDAPGAYSLDADGCRVYSPETKAKLKEFRESYRG